MQLILPIIAVGVAAVIYFFKPLQAEKKEVLSNKTHVSVSIETPTPTSQETTSQEENNTSNPTPTPTAASSTDSSSNDFVYPDSKNKGGGNYESNDDPDVITNWYKEKIKNMGMNVKTFVTTKTNGNVLNKLSGANANISVQIEIEKNEADTSTKIKISE